MPVYLTHGTFQCQKIDEVIEYHFIKPDQSFNIGNLEVLPVTVPHDANEPCQFVLKNNNKKLGILTDLGSISPHVQSAYADCEAIVLEANHDYQLLMNGDYPPSLKRRVAGSGDI